MGVKLKDFITALAKKAGFDTESETAKPFFAELAETDVPDDIVKGIDNSLISLSEAKNNHPELKNLYTKQALDGVDQTIMDLIKDFQLDDTIKAEILGEKSTYKRGPLLTRKIVELERLKASKTGSQDKQEIQKQIDQLHADLAAEKKARAEEKSGFDNQRMDDKKMMKLFMMLNGQKTIHDELDPETRFTILHTLVQKELQDKQAKLTFDDQGNFILLKNDGTNYFGENHQQIKPLQFIEQSLAKNKQLKVSDSPGSNGATTRPGAQPTRTGGDDTKESQQTRVIDRNQQAIKDYEKATANGSMI